jgi:uncharacterized sporulation protein YeaH/YhbH (DUF444 family)
MSIFIDRRPNGNKKNSNSKKKFLDRNEDSINDALKNIIEKESIEDLANSQKEFEVTISEDGLREPKIHKDISSGNHKKVLPHNDQFSEGDVIPNQGGGSGNGSGEGDASNEGQGEDNYEFRLSQKDFLDFIFDEMALPNLHKTNIKNTEEKELQRAGFTNVGNPASLCVKTSYIKSLGRKIASEAFFDRKIKELQDKNADPNEIQCLIDKKEKVPFMLEKDLMYRHRDWVSKPSSSAVMFCVMDISGSVTEQAKELSKTFFLLLYLFLNKNYKNVDIRFISHTTESKEVSEEEFFYSKETGGTIVSSAFHVVNDIIDAEYDSTQWNIYVAQSSDGDNWREDNPYLIDILSNEILQKVNYMTYLEVKGRGHSDLMSVYKDLANKFDNFKIGEIKSKRDVYNTLIKLFNKENA